MFIHTAKSVVPVTALLIISVIAACGGEGTAARDDQTSTALPSPTTGTSAAPTATFVAVEVTPAPVPTEPPVPTATIRPGAWLNWADRNPAPLPYQISPWHSFVMDFFSLCVFRSESRHPAPVNLFSVSDSLLRAGV